MLRRVSCLQARGILSDPRSTKKTNFLCYFIQYETPSDDVRRLFEEHGEIKTFFDLIGNRGMVFVTYVRLNFSSFSLRYS